MPIFEYICSRCEHRFETFVRGSASPAHVGAQCPACKSEQVVRQLSVFAVGGASSKAAAAATPCGMCGDPRGAGACSLN